MNDQIILTITEFIASLIVEGIILSMVFNWISNRSQQKQQDFIVQEMNNIEKQNKFIFTQLQEQIQETKQDLLSEIKQSAHKQK